MTEFHLHKKNIFITGASMGLGLASAKQCLQRGARVFLCARHDEALQKALFSLREEGFSEVLGCTADVTDESQIEKAIDLFESKFGPLHGTIHAAGVYGTIGSITEVDPGEWLQGVHINLFGSFIVARQSCKRWKQQKGGRLVLFSGGGATSPFPNYTSYACGKAAVVRFAETIAEEMAPYQIEVNCIAPGFVITRLHEQTLKAQEKAGRDFVEKTKRELERGGVPIELGATAAAFFVSDASKGITGKLIAAPYDSWKQFPERMKELRGSDLFTLRRIVPKDRGLSWQ